MLNIQKSCIIIIRYSLFFLLDWKFLEAKVIPFSLAWGMVYVPKTCWLNKCLVWEREEGQDGPQGADGLRQRPVPILLSSTTCPQAFVFCWIVQVRESPHPVKQKLQEGRTSLTFLSSLFCLLSLSLYLFWQINWMSKTQVSSSLTWETWVDVCTLPSCFDLFQLLDGRESG